jgi:hypothetical protein
MMSAKEPPPKPVVIFTKNGQEIGRVYGPPDATDVHIRWGNHPNGGTGYWTKNGDPIRGSDFPIPPGTNDYHLSPSGDPREGFTLTPPPGANDAEFEWQGDRFTGGWWTRDGQRIEPIPIPEDPDDRKTFSFDVPDEGDPEAD